MLTVIFLLKQMLMLRFQLEQVQLGGLPTSEHSVKPLD